jgi:hypothetical protein
LDYIITGTGRCGTLFAANLLTSSGIVCTHEAVFTPMGLDYALEVLSGKSPATNSMISWGENLSDYEIDSCAESSYMSAPFLGRFSAKVIHLVRNPYKVVSSFLGLGYFCNPYPSAPGSEAYEQFIYGHIPEMNNEMPQLDRACLYWILWNEAIESSGKVQHRQRIESSLDGLWNFLGSRGTYSKSCNVSRDSLPQWSPAQIQNPSVRRRLKDAAKKYGYHLIF